MISSPIGFSLEDGARDIGIRLGPRERDIEVPSPACGGGSESRNVGPQLIHPLPCVRGRVRVEGESNYVPPLPRGGGKSVNLMTLETEAG
jgi:hypothetical protein